MFTHHVVWYAPVISDGETYIYEDKRTGLVFTTYGSLPDSDEIEHVKAYHAGLYCPVMVGGGTACETFGARTGAKRVSTCYEPTRAGKW